ncbi:MAG TPA: hypothetical protein VF084_05840 [Nitrososphaeraceae archaeon]
MKKSFTMKTINEIFVLRNYIKNILGKPLESNYKTDLIYPLFDVCNCCGRFNDIENVGELNHFVNDVIKNTYYNFDSSKN